MIAKVQSFKMFPLSLPFFPLFLQVKAFLADPSAFVAAIPVAAETAAPAAAAAAAPAKEAAKEESEESDEDMGFGLFD